MLNPLMICFVIALCSGCTQRYAVTYTSDPYGATLYDGEGHQLGNLPVTLYYEPTNDAIKSGNIGLAATKARWVSGASADGPQILYIPNGTSQAYKFIRPDDVPGIEEDRSYGQLLLQAEQAKTDALIRGIQLYQQRQIIQ